MKVSVLIPAFRSRAFISTALQGIAAQTHGAWELIVVEDGSRDGTESLIETFSSSSGHRVVYRNMGTSVGAGAVRNRLLDLATGDVLAFLEANDCWEPTHLASALDLLGQGHDVVVTGVRPVDLTSAPAVGAARELNAALISDPVLTLFRQNAFPSSSSVVLKRDLAGRTGQFDPTLRIGADRDYWLRCALEGGRFGHTFSATCHHVPHEDASIERMTAVAEYELRFYEKYRSLVEVPLKLRRHLLARSLVRLGRLLRQQDPTRSAACFWRAWQCEPFNPRIPFHLAFTGWRPTQNEKAA